MVHSVADADLNNSIPQGCRRREPAKPFNPIYVQGSRQQTGGCSTFDA